MSTLESRLEKALDKALNSLEKGIDFMSDQLPAYIKELLVWFTIQELIYAIIGLILLIAVPLMATRSIKNIYNSDKDGSFKKGKFNCDILNTGGQTIVFGIVMVTIIATAAGIALINLEWLKIMVAPKVWLVEYLVRLKG